MNQTALLAPVLALTLWTFTIFLVMAFGRLRSMDNPQDAAHTDNYNHLFEQPVAFYVVTLSIALINSYDSLMVQLAWAFVVLRIIHSLVQLTFNMVLVRFLLFAAGWLIIAYMAYSQLIT